MINNLVGLTSTPDLKRNAVVSGKGSTVITGWELIRRQFMALFIKRFHHARRSRKGLIAQVMASVCHIDELKGYAGRVAWEDQGSIAWNTCCLSKSVNDKSDQVSSFKIFRDKSWSCVLMHFNRVFIVKEKVWQISRATTRVMQNHQWTACSIIIVSPKGKPEWLQRLNNVLIADFTLWFS